MNFRKGNPVIRLMAAAYLFYIVFSLWKAEEKALLEWAFIVLFGVCGIIFVITSIKDLKK